MVFSSLSAILKAFSTLTEELQREIEDHPFLYNLLSHCKWKMKRLNLAIFKIISVENNETFCPRQFNIFAEYLN